MSSNNELCFLSITDGTDELTAVPHTLDCLFCGVVVVVVCGGIIVRRDSMVDS